MIITGIYDERFDADQLVTQIQSPVAGAIVTFSGITRAPAGDKVVTHLEYEAHVVLANQQLLALANAAYKRWTLTGIVAVHRTGKVDVGQSGVLVAVTSGHREEAFLAARYLIDEIKDSVAIWKKEVYEDGSSRWL